MSKDKIDSYFQDEVKAWEQERVNERWGEDNTISLSLHTHDNMMRSVRVIDLIKTRKDISDYFKLRKKDLIEVPDFELQIENELDKLFDKIKDLIETKDEKSRIDILAKVYYNMYSQSYKFIFLVKEKP
jgi:hypothetical protein